MKYLPLKRKSKTVFYKNQMWVFSKSGGKFDISVEVLTDAGLVFHDFRIPAFDSSVFLHIVANLQRDIEGGLANYWLLQNKADFLTGVLTAYLELV